MRATNGHRYALDGNGAGGGAIGSRDGSDHLGSTRTDEAGNSQNLAAVDREVDVFEDTGAPEPRHFESNIGLLVARRTVSEHKFAPDHRPHDVTLCDVALRPGSGERSISQAHNRIGKFTDFVKAMRDVDDSHATFAQQVDLVEYSSRLRFAEGRRWLIEDDEARVASQRPGDLDLLLSRD